MAGTVDKAKGRIKEAAGALTDDPALKREGKLDQLAGDVKDGIEKAVDAVKDTVTGKKVPR
ncbi:MAG: CsbD family protein [Candidatus Binatia bacterium]